MGYVPLAYIQLLIVNYELSIAKTFSSFICQIIICYLDLQPVTIRREFLQAAESLVP